MHGFKESKGDCGSQKLFTPHVHSPCFLIDEENGILPLMIFIGQFE